MASDKDHRFLDEAGDCTFYGKGRQLIVGHEGVSKAFILGSAKIREPLAPLRRRILDLGESLVKDPAILAWSSVKKRTTTGDFFFHAKDDPGPVREAFFDLLKGMDISFEAMVARKIPSLFLRKHHSQDSEFYADLLGHLLKNKMGLKRALVFNIAKRGNTTRQHVLEQALSKAIQRHRDHRPTKSIEAMIRFNVQTPRTEPLLAISDYLCWAVQRVFERGDIRPFDAIRPKVSLVVDLYDQEKWPGSKHYYNGRNPLRASNMLGPLPP